MSFDGPLLHRNWFFDVLGLVVVKFVFYFVIVCVGEILAIF